MGRLAVGGMDVDPAGPGRIGVRALGQHRDRIADPELGVLDSAVPAAHLVMRRRLEGLDEKGVEAVGVPDRQVGRQGVIALGGSCAARHLRAPRMEKSSRL